MASSGRQKSIALFITLGSCLVAVAVTLNIGLIVWTWRTGVMLVLGALFCSLIIAGVVLNTIFLVREIRRNEQHDQFINAVTHELKTPVSSIRLYLETLQTREMDDAKRREFYAVMLADSDRLAHTIDQVLRAGRAKTWRKHHHRELLDLTEIVKDCVRLARLRHHLPDEAVGCECAKAQVWGDADELKAAVTNLLDNAIKYSKDEVRVTAEVVLVDGNNVAVRVRDKGVGISPAELKRIFRRFYRIPGIVTTRVKGTGLGLYIVGATAKRHGGKAYAESEGAGRGSTFTLQLPGAGAA
ncbi:MAG: Two-component sensor histidine kinase [Bryobacterales bacterium]|nr:Two-component sensor histidine kinase [Bryobacterales bacterium]